MTTPKFVALALLCFAFAPPAVAGGLSLNGLGGANISVPVTSVKESRFRTVVKQQYDFSCGSAALATLLTYHYGRPTNETTIFEGMFETGDKELIQKQGFSLLDMKTYLASIGLDSDGYRVPLDEIAKAEIPAIVLIETRGYRHFVVLKGMNETEVLIGDPAYGVSIMKRSAFAPLMVSEVAFVIRDDSELAQANFNAERDWAVRAKAPFGTALTRQGLASFSLHFPGRHEF